MTSSARDLRYGRRGGRWAEPWTTQDEARYIAALAEQPDDQTTDQPDLFTHEDQETDA